MAYVLSVVEVQGGREHVLPADTVTRDTVHAGGPIVPLAFRAHHEVFFVSGERWRALSGKELSLAGR
jgi:hypothetical protein